MNQTLRVGILASWLVTGTAFADTPGSEAAQQIEAEAAGPRNTVTISPINLIFGTVSLEYERRLGSHASLFVGPEVLLPFGAFRGLDEDESLFGVEGRIGVRLFPFGNALEGFYTAFDLNIGWARAEAGEQSATGSTGSLGLSIGGQWQVDDVFAVGLDIGGGWRLSQIDLSDGRSVGVSGPMAKVRLSVGAAF